MIEILDTFDCGDKVAVRYLVNKIQHVTAYVVTIPPTFPKSTLQAQPALHYTTTTNPSALQAQPALHYTTIALHHKKQPPEATTFQTAPSIFIKVRYTTHNQPKCIAGTACVALHHNNQPKCIAGTACVALHHKVASPIFISGMHTLMITPP